MRQPLCHKPYPTCPMIAQKYGTTSGQIGNSASGELCSDPKTNRLTVIQNPIKTKVVCPK